MKYKILNNCVASILSQKKINIKYILGNLPPNINVDLLQKPNFIN